MATYRESKEECIARYKRNLLYFFIAMAVILGIDYFFIRPYLKVDFHWAAYTFSGFLILAALWPQRPVAIDLSNESISSEEKEYPLSSVRSIIVKKRKVCIQAENMSDWEIPNFKQVANFVLEAKKLNPAIQIIEFA